MKIEFFNKETGELVFDTPWHSGCKWDEQYAIDSDGDVIKIYNEYSSCVTDTFIEKRPNIGWRIKENDNGM